jgi:hypothetical protein
MLVFPDGSEMQALDGDERPRSLITRIGYPLAKRSAGEGSKGLMTSVRSLPAHMRASGC